MVFHRVVVAAVVLSLPAPAAAADGTRGGLSAFEAPVRLDYEVYGGGAHALDLHLRLDANAADGYGIEFQARTAGWIKRFFPFVMASEATGRLGDTGPVPRRFATANRWDDRDVRRVRLRYGQPGAAPEVTAEPPPEQDDRPVVPESARRDTRDPLSAVLALLLGRGERTCTGSEAIFDGRRRYDMAAEPGESDRFDSDDYAAYSGPARICTLTFRQKDGFWTKYDARNRYPTTVRVWLAPVLAVAGAPDLPVKVALETDYVAVRAHLVAVRRGAEAALPATDLVVERRAQAGEDGG